MSQNPNPRRYQRRSREFWLRTIDQWQDSGLSQRQFCEDNDLAIATFQLWRRRLAKKNGGGDPGLQKGTSDEAGFVAVDITDRNVRLKEVSEPIKILLPSGVRLQVPPHCSGRSLAEVLWALQATDPC